MNQKVNDAINKCLKELDDIANDKYEFNDISEIPLNWNYYESLPPSEASLNSSKTFIISFITNIFNRGLRWIHPEIISANMEYGIDFEWYGIGKEEKTLFIDICDSLESTHSFFMAYHIIDGKMIFVDDDYDSFNIENCLALWEWLVT